MPPKKAQSTVSPELQELQNSWKTMFQKTLPEAATSKSPSQSKWPVHVDHCFARIILDKVVGQGKSPWMTIIKSPAYKNMSEEQLKDAVKLGEAILSGDADLVELDEESLAVRGKKGKKNAVERKSGKLSKDEMDEAERKRRQNDDDKEKDSTNAMKQEAEEKSLDEGNLAEGDEGDSTASLVQNADGGENTSNHADRKRKLSNEETKALPPTKAHKTSSHKPDPALQSKINQSSKSSFQKSVLSLLLEIPEGCYTTYNLMSKHLSSSPRAVGNALRNNPFAPEVPCHRVLATGGGIGGFGGSWGRKGEEGKNDKEKYRLLRSEGVKFDGKGRVVGSPWNGFS